MRIIYLTLFAIILTASLKAQEFKRVARNNNEFAFKLYGELKGEYENKNIFFSPFSISNALAMTYAGARNKTEKQMSTTLCFNLDQQKFHASYKKLLNEISSNTEGAIQLNIAQSLWAQKDYHFLDSYFDLIKFNYNSKLSYVNYRPLNERIEAVNKINNWVDSTTRHKISSVLNNDAVDEMTRLILVNAIYFYGKWALELKKENTKDWPFYINKQKTVQIPLMNVTDNFRYFEDINVKVLEIPYKENKASLIVILPNEIEGINKIETSLDLKSYINIVENLQLVKTRLAIPKFKTQCEFMLKETLSKMGMPIAFTYLADFSGMTGTLDLYIDKVIHKAIIEVSEEGTEAAAVTAVIMTERGASPKYEMKEFIIDHPFMFLIRENATGSILFMGKIINPNE